MPIFIVVVELGQLPHAPTCCNQGNRLVQDFDPTLPIEFQNILFTFKLEGDDTVLDVNDGDVAAVRDEVWPDVVQDAVDVFWGQLVRRRRVKAAPRRRRRGCGGRGQACPRAGGPDLGGSELEAPRGWEWARLGDSDADSRWRKQDGSGGGGGKGRFHGCVLVWLRVRVRVCSFAAVQEVGANKHILRLSLDNGNI